jgi:predicted flap endonuclease-1-like 5' DNA nuclease
MAKGIEKIEGIGPAQATKLSGAGIDTVDDLLAKCATAKGRAAVAESTRIAEKQLLRWVNIADLMRITGVGEEFSELLEAAGVDTVKELQHRNADNLTAKIAEVNEQKKLCRRTPSASEVAKWIEQAKTLPQVVTH